MTTALTDTDLTYFWAGPLGYLQQLPLLPVGGSTDATEELFGAVLVSLTGGATLDVLGHKRTWQLDWVCLSWAETAAVHAWFQGLTTAPLRLVDPRSGNWLTRDGAAAGSYHRDTRAHLPAAGTVTFGLVTDYPAALFPLVNGGISWAVPASSSTLLIDSTDRIPLIPSQQITAALWVKGSGTVQVSAQLYDVTGAVVGSVSSGSVPAGAWSPVTVTFTPTTGQVSAVLVVTADAGSARTIQVGPGIWHPTNTSWVPGSGCPVVLPVARKITYPGLANQETGLTLREA